MSIRSEFISFKNDLLGKTEGQLMTVSDVMMASAKWAIEKCAIQVNDLDTDGRVCAELRQLAKDLETP